jgi:hypothetical protein
MKRIITLAFLSAMVWVVLQSSINKTMRSEGAAPGHTGSPGDGFKNCTNCHGGTATTVAGWITSDIPESGYVPGETYTITTTNAEPEGDRFGFQVSPQNIAGDLLGTLVITDSVQTQLVGDDKYITYTEHGIDGVGSKTWTFDWIAPDSGVKEVTFYGAYNSNFQGHKGDNHVFLSTLTVKEHGTTNVFNVVKEVTEFLIYPNPAKEMVNISFNLEIAAHLILDIYDIQGKLVAQLINEKQTGEVSTKFNTSTLSNGNYFVRLQVNDKNIVKKLTVNH